MGNKVSLLKKTFAWIGIVFLAVLLTIVSLGIWLTPEKMDFDSLYHPFKTEQAKVEYLKFYDKRAKKWPVISTTKMLDTSYGQTFVRISGSDNPKSLVLLHGAGGNSLQWLPNIEELSKYYKVFAIDNIYDNGRSIPGKVMTNEDDFVAWLNELFDALEIHDRINIAGLSYGGWIAAQYALKFPNRLNKVVLLAPAGTVAQLSPGWIVRAVSVVIPHKYFAHNFEYWLAEDTVNSGNKGRSLIDEHVDETYMAMRSFKGKPMVNPSVLTDEELQSITPSTLFLVGENEKIYPPHEVINRLNKVAPQIQTKLIMNAGHDLTMVQSGKVNKLIIEFLNQPAVMP